MEELKILIDDIEKQVFGLFYIYNNKYYFIYTEKEIDENGYVILYMTQIGRETKNTETGPVETGYMVGLEITDLEEQKNVQTSISYIVEDKKNNTINPQIQYLPISMLSNLKIVSKKRFRLLKSIMSDNFKLTFDSVNNLQSVEVTEPVEINQPIQQANNIVNGETSVPLNQFESTVLTNEVDTVQTQNIGVTEVEQSTNNQVEDNETIIIDYRAKFFEEQEKNKELQSQLDVLTLKLEEIKKVIE